MDQIRSLKIGVIDNGDYGVNSAGAERNCRRVECLHKACHTILWLVCCALLLKVELWVSIACSREQTRVFFLLEICF